MSKFYADLFHEDMQDEKAIKIYTETLQFLKNNHWPAWYVEIIMQNYRATTDPADILAFVHVHCYIVAGKVWTCELEVHHEPFGDSEIDQNNRILKNHLPDIFTGEFIPEKGRGARSDGYIEAKSDFTVTDAWSINEQTTSRLAATRIFPLEVGYTKSYTTYRHLVENGSVARWPYGSKKIYLLDMHEHHMEMKKVLLPSDIVAKIANMIDSPEDQQ